MLDVAITRTAPAKGRNMFAKIRAVGAVVCGGLIAMSSEATAGVGNSNPTLAFNLSDLSDWSTAQPYIDLMRYSRSWYGNANGQFAAYSTADLVALNVFDADGWPTYIPEGVSTIETIWAWGGSSAIDPVIAQLRATVYVLEYEGEGTVTVSGDVRILSSEPGRILLQNTAGGNFAVGITSTDPNHTGNYIRNMTLVEQLDEDLLDAGMTFNPEWINLIDDARQIRFMGWQETNYSKAQTVDDIVWSNETNLTSEAALDDMVLLANQIGADPWFCMPHLADDEYVRAFATYVRDNLDPSLVVRVEYSNELWNFAFSQTVYQRDQALAEWGEAAYLDYQAKRAVEVALIWEDVFGDEAESRLINVLGSQAASLGVTKQLLKAAVWLENEPDTYVAPASVFEEVAITSYFGTSTISDATLRADLISRIQADPDAAAEWLYDRMLDPTYQWSIPYSAAIWQQQADLVHSYGLDLVAYEGGQHLLHSFAVSGLTEQDLTTLVSFLSDFIRSEYMGELYQVLWDTWASISDGPMMLLDDVSSVNKFGAWGHYINVLDYTPRAALIEQMNALSQPWWDALGGDQYLQGIVVRGDIIDDILTGTDQEDFMTGDEGDDIFIAGLGNDGINGGTGTDTLWLTGSLTDYTVVVDGEGYLITGPDGVDYIYDIEFLRFSDGTTFDVSAVDTTTGGTGPKLPGSDAVLQPGIMDYSRATSGVYVTALSRWTKIGAELGLTSETAFFAAPITAPALNINGVSVSVNYYSIHSDLTDNNGTTVTGSALTTADLLGDVRTDIHTVIGSNFSDRIFGRAANDKLYGKDGDDILNGGAGDDQLYGGAGNDKLTGGLGNDYLYSGAGEDVFEFSRNCGHDVVTDYGDSDTINFGDFFSGIADPAATASMVNGVLVFNNGISTISIWGLSIYEVDLLV